MIRKGTEDNEYLEWEASQAFGRKELDLEGKIFVCACGKCE
jgi:hypothetical protein